MALSYDCLDLHLAFQLRNEYPHSVLALSLSHLTDSDSYPSKGGQVNLRPNYKHFRRV